MTPPHLLPDPQLISAPPNRMARPVFLNPLQLQMPVGALTSIGHRLSGIFLAASTPAPVYLLGHSLEGEARLWHFEGLDGCDTLPDAHTGQCRNRSELARAGLQLQACAAHHWHSPNDESDELGGGKSLLFATQKATKAQFQAFCGVPPCRCDQRTHRLIGKITAHDT